MPLSSLSWSNLIYSQVYLSEEYANPIKHQIIRLFASGRDYRTFQALARMHVDELSSNLPIHNRQSLSSTRVVQSSLSLVAYTPTHLYSD